MKITNKRIILFSYYSNVIVFLHTDNYIITKHYPLSYSLPRLETIISLLLHLNLKDTQRPLN